MLSAGAGRVDPVAGQVGRFRRSLSRKLVLRLLDRFEHGTIVVRDAAGRHTVGAGTPEVMVHVHDPGTYRQLLLGGTVGAGESYMAGGWDCEDLVTLTRLLLRNRQALDRLDGVGSVAGGLIDRAAHSLRRNSRTGSRRNIHAHYDLGNRLFECFLDDHMMYSAAVFERPGQTLESASLAKLDRLCRKLELRPDDHLLEIGTGWGGLAEFAAARYGCRVTTTTVSEAQYEYSRNRIEAAGLQDRVTVLHDDYRALTGRFDKLVSVEMVEAVGHQYLDTYFDLCNRVLADDGLMAIQAITIADQRYDAAVRSVDFIKKHIFPGSFIPSVSVLVNAAARSTNTVLVNLEDIGADYARTLDIWRRRTDAQRERILTLGFDEPFLRGWAYYLSYCEGGFLERAISDVQLLFAKPGYRGPIWRA